MYKLLKPLSISSILWALLVTAIVLLVATSANAQTAPQSTEVVPPTAPVPDTLTSTSSRPTLPPVPTPKPVTPMMLPPAGETSTSSTGLPPTMNVTEVQQQRSVMLEQRLTEIKERRAELEEKRLMLQNASSTRRAVLPVPAQQKALNGMAKVQNVLSTSISKSRDFVERVKSRATTLEARGLNVGTIVSYIEAATEQLDLAEQSLRDIDVNAEYAITSAEPRTDWQDVREQFAAVHTSLKEAHDSLRNATTEMKNLIGNSAVETELSPSAQ